MTVSLAVLVAAAMIAGSVLIVSGRRRPRPTADWQSAEQTSAELRRAVADLTEAARKARETADRLDRRTKESDP